MYKLLIKNGKNFESITQYFNARQKRFKLDEGVVGAQRSKEQIRHFYYRTWHKIAKYISLPTFKGNDQLVTSTATNSSNRRINERLVSSSPSSSCSLRDIQVKCLIAYNALMNKSLRRF